MALPIVAGGDQDAAAKYNEAINNALSALTARSQPNLFSVAGELLDPGRTGSAFEGFGRAGKELGRQQQYHEQQAPQLAMMKATLAGQQYEIANQNKALGMLAPYMGVSSAQEVSDKISSGNMPPNLVDSIPGSMMPLLSSLHPKLAEGLNKGFMQDVEKKKLQHQVNELDLKTKEFGLKEKGFDFDLGKILINEGPEALNLIKRVISPDKPEFPKLVIPLPVPSGRISSTYGPRNNPFDSSKKEFHSGIDIAASEGSPVNAIFPGKVVSVGPMGDYGNRVEIRHNDGSTSYYAHLKDAIVKLHDVITPNQQIGTVGQSGRTTGSHVEFGLHANGKSIDPTSLFTFGNQPAQTVTTPKVASAESKPPLPLGSPATDLDSLPLSKATDLKVKRLEQSDKLWDDHVSDIISATPMLLNRQNKQIEEVMNIAKKTPQIFNILGQSTWWAGMKEAIDQGIQIGRFGSISLPIQRFNEISTLTKDERKDLITVQRNLGDIYLSSIKERGKVLGSNPTNFEDRLYKVPMASEKDPSISVLDWGAKHLLYNRAKLSLFDAYKPYAQNPNLGANYFFTDNKSPYNTILENYNKFYDQLSTK